MPHTGGERSRVSVNIDIVAFMRMSNSLLRARAPSIRVAATGCGRVLARMSSHDFDKEVKKQVSNTINSTRFIVLAWYLTT